MLKTNSGFQFVDNWLPIVCCRLAKLLAKLLFGSEIFDYILTLANWAYQATFSYQLQQIGPLIDLQWILLKLNPKIQRILMLWTEIQHQKLCNFQVIDWNDDRSHDFNLMLIACFHHFFLPVCLKQTHHELIFDKNIKIVRIWHFSCFNIIPAFLNRIPNEKLRFYIVCSPVFNFEADW